MSNTLSLTISGTYTPTTGDPFATPGLTAVNFTITGNPVLNEKITVANTDTTIPLPAGTLGIAIFKNLDPSIGISLRVAAAGTKFCRLAPGDCWPFRIDSGITAPVAIADSGTPLMQCVIFPA